MHSNRHPHVPSVEDALGGREIRKPAVTEARREQNRRAQRAFRERRKAKKSVPPTSNIPRRLKARAPEFELDLSVRSSKPEILDQTQDTPSSEVGTLDSSDQGSSSVDGLWDKQTESTCTSTTEEVPFTFSSPQTLFPARDNLILKNCNTFSEFLTFTRDHLRPTIWPHGVTTTLAACLFNARALGIDLDRIMDPHYISPFYRPSFSLMVPPGSVVQPTSLDAASDPQLAVFGSLRPCFAQVMFAHHACIDLLPLPRLRETAVMLNVRAQQNEDGVASQGLDSVQELKKDVYVRQGVRFRGTGELRRDECIMYDESGRHCGHPWERASWAVAPWFARKWKYFMDL